MFQRQPPLLGQHMVASNNGFGQLVERCRAGLHLHPPGVYAGNLQDALHQSRLVIRLMRQRVQVLLPFLRVLPHQVGVQFDCRDRRPEFMGDVSDETGLHPVQCLEVSDIVDVYHRRRGLPCSFFHHQRGVQFQV